MCVQVVLLAELVGDGDAGEVLAPVTLHRVDVEKNGQGGEQAQEDQQEDTDLDPLTVHIRTPETKERKRLKEQVKYVHMKYLPLCSLTINPPDVWQEGKGQEEP